MNKKSNITLILENGMEFPGYSFGFDKSIAGEVVFNTAMTGYPESLTDPSYKGQILVATYPLVGNYGVPGEDSEQNLRKYYESDKIAVQGFIISDYSTEYSHWNAEKSLSDWLKSQKIPGIYGIDARELTQVLRESGTMLGKNCGVKNNIIRCLLGFDTTVVRVPFDYDISKESYDGLFISNGPGDPEMCVSTINTMKEALQDNRPVFGICLGSQLMALASGASTYKLKYGHRSHNQPVRKVGENSCYITSQNHGFAVDNDTLGADWEPLFINVNDGTCEGIRHKSKPFFSTQFHPEASGGPTDTKFLFDEFINMIEKNKTT
jgi:carbamoylphosphate synthase small subunit